MSKEKDPQNYTLVTPKEAAEALQQNTSAVLVDVRSQMEFLMIGHPVGAINVAWIDEPNWDINPNFVTEVRRILLGRVSGREAGNVPIVLLCRSDNRSRDAAKALYDAGLRDIFVIKDGFEGPLNDQHQRGSLAGWRFENLPWEQC